jgi:hypothetical protein
MFGHNFREVVANGRLKQGRLGKNGGVRGTEIFHLIW